MTREEAMKLIQDATGMKYGTGKAADLLLRIADEQWNAAVDACAGQVLENWQVRKATDPWLLSMLKREAKT